MTLVTIPPGTNWGTFRLYQRGKEWWIRLQSFSGQITDRPCTEAERERHKEVCGARPEAPG